MADTVFDPFADETAKLTGFRELPITAEERLVVQNLFDTQPKRRAAYMKKLGFELNPNNDNEYRPLGSDLPYSEIDPGLEAYTKPGSISNFIEEAKKDAGDLLFDIAVDGTLTASLGAKGGAAGAAVGSAVGTPAIGGALGGLVGLFTGGALGKAGAEALKELAGDVILDESVPADKGLVAMQALISGAAPLIAKGIGAAGKAGYQAYLKSTRDGIINAAKQSGGKLTPELLERAAKNPEMFTPEAVDGATKRLTTEYKKLFGLDPEDVVDVEDLKRIQPDSAIGKLIAPLRAQADMAEEAFSKDPAANWKLEELVNPLKATAAQIADKFDKTADEAAALGYLRDKIKFIESKFKPTPGEVSSILGPNGVPLVGAEKAAKAISYKDGRDFLRVIQDDAFNREIPGSSFLAKAVGGGGLRKIADNKAREALARNPALPNLPLINQKTSEALGFFNVAKRNLTPTKLQSAFIGADNMAKSEVRDTLEQLDRLTGSSYSQKFQDGTLQREVENIFKAPGITGSSRTNPSVLAEAAKSAAIGAGIGGSAGAAIGAAPAGAVIGGLLGARQGAQRAAALSQPEQLIPKITSLTQQIQKSQASAPSELLQKALATPAAQEIGRSEAVTGGVPQPKEEPKVFDPFDE